MVDFNKLRENRKLNLSALQRTLEKTERRSYNDDRVWKYSRNEKNISENIIRFLPISYADYNAVEEGRYDEVDLTPMIKLRKHQFQGPTGKWYIQNSLQTFGEPDPISEWTMPQWAKLKGKDKEDPVVKAQREVLKKFIPGTEYYANILVIKDGTHPENNGKVFLFCFGEAIRKLIESATSPEFASQEKIDIFDYEQGANLILNIKFEKREWKSKDIWIPDFKPTSWEKPSALADGDEEKIEEYWKSSYSLLEFLDRKHFPNYEQSKSKFYQVMGLDDNGNPSQSGVTISKSASDFLNNKPAEATEPEIKEQRSSKLVIDNEIDPLAEFEALLMNSH